MPKVIKPVEDVVRKAADYHTYRLIKQLARYDDNVEHELHWMARKTAVQMKNGTISGKDHMSVIAFLQGFNSAFDACGIKDGTVIWLFTYYVNEPADADFESLVPRRNSVDNGHERAVSIHSEVVSSFLKG